jgi:hypothetical protein
MGNVKGKQAMSKVPKDRSSRVWTRLSVALRERITGYCAASGIAERTVFEAALGQYIDGTSDMALVMRRIDRLGRALERTHQTLDVLSGAFGAFVQLWLAYAPNMPEERLQAARAKAEGGYRKFLEHVAAQLSEGRRFIDDLPKEAIANDAELGEILGKATAEQGGAR